MRPGFGGAIIIDDPIKPDEARSDIIRTGVLDWFQNTLESRKNDPGNTPIILIMQRVHQEDLSGWLLEGGNGESWEHVCLASEGEGGEPLWPEKHSSEDLARMRMANPYVYAGQYLQTPAPPSGGIFRPDMLQPVGADPAGVEWVRGWDLASLDGRGDYTAGAKLGRLPDGRFIIGDLIREQVAPDERDRIMINTARRDGPAVRVSIPQDPGQAGRTQVLDLTRKLAGFTVHSSPESGDKVTRAEPLASQINVGNVLITEGPWAKALRDEMALFPNGKHDDQIDALSRAFALLIGGGEPSPVASRVEAL